MASSELTLADLDAALDDERHLGFGYAARVHLPYGQRIRLDGAIVKVANELDLDADSLFRWTNSKYGRWLADSAEAVSEAASEALVRRYLNAAVVAALS